MSQFFDLRDADSVLEASRAARGAISRGELVVFPTDTVYGIAADAFNPEAVQRLLDTKGRTRQTPPPVLIGGSHVLQALAAEITEPQQRLANAFWPGPLTMVMLANPQLAWDLGETDGTVALRVPAHSATLELLKETGPLAVSSANKHGVPAATTAEGAREMLGDSVAVYLEAGEVKGGGESSTILDVTQLTNPSGEITILRQGALAAAEIKRLLPEAKLVL